MFRRINLHKKLDLKQREDLHTDLALEQVYVWLYEDFCNDQDLKTRIRSGEHEPISVLPRILDIDRIYSEDSIRSLAIEYRLRFLDIKHFKPEIPGHAVASLRAFEQKSGVEIKGAHILAPSELFELTHCEDDPLLFVRVGYKTWYLIDQWGSDLHPLRKLLYFPARNKASFALSVFTLSFLLSSFFPVHAVIDQFTTVDLLNRFSFFTWIFICNSALIAFIGLSWINLLSKDQWNSPYIRRSF